MTVAVDMCYLGLECGGQVQHVLQIILVSSGCLRWPHYQETDISSQTAEHLLCSAFTFHPLSVYLKINISTVHSSKSLKTDESSQYLRNLILNLLATFNTPE